MSALVTQTWKGVPAFKARLKKAPERLARESYDANLETAQAVAERASNLVPVSSGKLKASIAVTAGGGQTPGLNVRGRFGRFTAKEVDIPAGAAAVSAGDREAFYAKFVELGTQAAPAQPFFWPSVRAEAAAHWNRMVNAAKKAA